MYIFVKAAYNTTPGPDTQGKYLLSYIPTSFLYLSYPFRFSNAGCLNNNRPGQLPGEPRHVHRL